MKTNKEIYLEHLNYAPVVLQETLDQIQTIIINLAMCGELAEVNDGFDEADSVIFNYEDFKNLSDHNVNLLYTLYDIIYDKRAELINVNGLQTDSLEDEDTPF